MVFYNAPYLDNQEHSVLDHTGIPGVGGGTSDLSNYVGDVTLIQSNIAGSFRSISGDADVQVQEGGSASIVGVLQATIGSPGGQVFVTASTDVHVVSHGGTARVDFVTGEGGGTIIFDSDSLGFFGSSGAAQPNIPASPTAQDIANVLIALGLATQTP